MSNSKSIENYLNSIEQKFNQQNKLIEYLSNRVKQLESETYKDEEIQRLSDELDKVKKDLCRGFPISIEEQTAIDQWKKKHDEEDHSYVTFDQRLRAEGVSGGRYSYHFVPTSLGTSGVVRCSCGAEFEFQEIG